MRSGKIAKQENQNRQEVWEKEVGLKVRWARDEGPWDTKKGGFGVSVLHVCESSCSILYTVFVLRGAGVGTCAWRDVPCTFLPLAWRDRLLTFNVHLQDCGLLGAIK